MSSGEFRSMSFSTEVENSIEALPLTTYKPRHYLYAVLSVFYRFFILSLQNLLKLLLGFLHKYT